MIEGTRPLLQLPILKDGAAILSYKYKALFVCLFVLQIALEILSQEHNSNIATSIISFIFYLFIFFFCLFYFTIKQ